MALCEDVVSVLLVVDCGAALDAISLLLVELDGVEALGAAALLAELVSGVELLGVDAGAVVLAAEALVLGLVELMLPEFTSVPLEVLPALPLEAGPGFAFAIASVLDCWLELLALGGFEDPLGLLVGDVELAGVSLLVGGGAPCDAGFTFVPEAGGTATEGFADGLEASVALDELDEVPEAAVPAVPLALLGLELLAPEVLHESEIMLTELTFRMFCAVPLIDPLLLLEAAPGALDPLPTVPDTATWCPTWLLRSDEPPCSCHTLPDWSVSEKLPLDPLRHP